MAVEADRSHRRDTLAGLLWPDQPQRKARQNVRQALSHLRQAIGDHDEATPFLLAGRETIQFNPDCDHWLDAATFAALVEDCKKHPHRRLATCLPCMRRLEQMVELYRGSFLEQFFLSDSSAFEEWAEVFGNDLLASAALDRLTHHTHTLTIRGSSYRQRQRRKEAHSSSPTLSAENAS